MSEIKTKEFEDIVEKISDYERLALLLEQTAKAIRNQQPIPPEAKGFVRSWDRTRCFNSVNSASNDAHRSSCNQQWEERHLKLNGDYRKTPRKTLTNDEHKRIEEMCRWGVLIELPVNSKALLVETRKITEGKEEKE
jgi:hypothetical protein